MIGPADECHEYGRNGLPSLSGSGQSVRCGVQAADDDSRDILPGEVEIQGAAFGVCGGNGNEVAGIPSKDTEQEGSGRELA